MSTNLELERAILDRRPAYTRGPFPSADIKKISPENTADLHTAFDLYFADIAGYTFNIKAMYRKPKSELLHMKDRLSRAFFDRYLGFREQRDSITQEETPDLHRHLVAVEENRSDLLRLIDTIIDSSEKTSECYRE